MFPQRLKRVYSFFESLFSLGIRAPRVTIIISVLVVILTGVKIDQLQMLFDVDDLIDSDFVTHSSLQELKQDYGAKNSVYRVFARENVPISSDDLCSLNRLISKEAVENEKVDKVFSLTFLRKSHYKNGKLTYPRVLPSLCERPFIKEPLTQIGPHPWQGILTANDNSDVASQMYLIDGHKKKGAFDPKVIEDIRHRTSEWNAQENKQFSVRWSGSAVYQYFMSLGYQQTHILNLVVVLLVIFFLKFFFGTYSSSLLLIGSLVYSTLLLHCLLSLFGFPIDVLSNSLFLMLTVSTLEDFVFLSTRRMTSNENWQNSFKSLLLPSFLTSLTTIIGFGSLVSSDLGIIQRFGLMAAVGAAIEWLTIFMVMPAVLSLFPALQNWTNRKKARGLSFAEKSSKWVLPRFWVRVLLGVYIVAGIGVFNLKIDDSPLEVFPENHELRQTADFLLQSRGWVADINILFKDSENQKAKIDLLEELKRTPHVVKVESSVELLDYMTSDLDGPVKTMVSRNLKQSEAYARFHLDDLRSRAIVYVDSMNLGHVSQLKSKIDELCKGGKLCKPAGSLISYLEFGTRVPSTLLKSLLISLLLVGLILVVLCKITEVNRAFEILLSAFWGPAVVLALLAVSGVQIYFVTCIFASILVGLSGDNAVQYILNSNERSLESGVYKVGSASLLVAFLMMILPASFMLSYFNPMRTLGVLFALGTICSLFGDLWILNGLLKKVKSKVAN